MISIDPTGSRASPLPVQHLGENQAVEGNSTFLLALKFSFKAPNIVT